MIEPVNTAWGGFYLRHYHHELPHTAERLLHPLDPWLGLFMQVVIRKP
uniref:Uncharacterized protein n=1 Tax=Candidatus Kentrum sp. FM TaxID=2126340 RepID=A0A450WTR0_9GAMM|nr:MAG: hypothetical protein BECKFM1743A_GA0114220_106813 [Candidatus Kentron sp. FM]VFJ73378.1 MAG: hypothetical protein BECKFM1743C_GA0114222_107252 [Candidatus Kentron sp. FM]VFK20400.1 MAG: hypothetical protein BECKFM1743B_GA0114221_106933 [Candidatus Kentron sp. FM]